MTPIPRSRSRAVCTALAALLALACGSSENPTSANPSPQPSSFPVTGTSVPELASFDRIITGLMQRWDIPGGAIAVVKDGRLVLARGYGYADVEAKEPVQPDALFRIASLSKPVTAVAALKLYEEGRLDLDARAFSFLPSLTPPTGSTTDPRIASITVRQLLWHTGGWDRDQSFDPMFRSTIAASAVGAPAPASVETVIRYMLGQRLDFDPGARYAYSNFGYAVLGRVIENASGQPYDEFVRTRVLAPMGITRTRLGRSLLSGRAAGEVRYYDPASATSVFPGGGSVTFPYGGFYLEAMDAHGGWIASTVDLVRFLTSVDGFPTRADVLRNATVALMTAPPPNGVWGSSAYHYGMGWLVRPQQGNWWHNGSLPGTSSLLVRAGNGLAWAVVFNARAMRAGSTFEQEVDPAIWDAVREVTTWPAHDLFAQFP